MEAIIGSKIFLTLSVVVAALIAFIFEWFPVDITALIIAVILIVLGLVTPDEGISGFSNSATVTVMAMFILSAGITRTGIVQTVRDWLIRWGGKIQRDKSLLWVRLSAQLLLLLIIRQS